VGRCVENREIAFLVIGVLLSPVCGNALFVDSRAAALRMQSSQRMVFLIKMSDIDRGTVEIGGFSGWIRPCRLRIETRRKSA